jgi:serine protease SohB
MEWLIEIAIFAGKTLLITGALIAVILVIAIVASRFRPPREQLEVENVNDRYDAFAEVISSVTRDPKAIKSELKAKAKEEKKLKKQHFEKPRIFVIDFDGDIRATQVEHLRGEVTAILASALPKDEVVVRVESSGGVVHGYGLAAAQLLRIRQAGLKLTVCVDKVAASGGYMMACTAEQLFAAPFAILGSIGVIAQVPNFNRVLKKHDIDYEEITAGELTR